MPVKFIGNKLFHDMFPPKKTKSVDFGVDVMVRRMSGAITELDKFLATLKQGMDFQGYALQTWTVDENPIFPAVTLNYKGVLNGIPKARSDDGMTIQSVSISAQLNDPESTSPTFGQITSYTRDIQFYAPSTTWFYISKERPTTSFGGVNNPADPKIISSRITGSNGRVYAGSNAPSAIITATFPAIVTREIDRKVSEIYGTPYFECESTEARTFFGG